MGICRRLSLHTLWVRFYPSKTYAVNNKSYCPFVNHLLNCWTVLYSFCLTSTVKNYNEVLRSNSNKCSSWCNRCTYYLFCRVRVSPAADTALLANGETVFSILFALLIFKERLSRIGYIAVTLILGGVFLVTTNLDFNSSIFKLNIGNVFVIASTIIWGLDNNICKIIVRRVDVSKLIQLKALIGGFILLGTVFILGIPFNIQREQLLPVFFLGVFGFAISLYLYLNSIKRIGVVKASSLLSLSAVFGLVFAIIFLHELISINQIIAISIMICGIHLMDSHWKERSNNSQIG